MALSNLMSNLPEALLDPIHHSPLLPEITEALQRQLLEEQQRRANFYAEMTPAQKVEFIDGQVVMHSPARNAHLDLTKFILQLLDLHVRQNNLAEVKVEKCLCVFPRNDYEPDIVYFCPEKASKFDPDTMKFPIPDLAVEVLSESTESRDRGVKFEDFAAHGVSEYWIVDAERNVLEQYLLKDDNFELETKASSGEVRSEVIPGFVAPIRAFFDPNENLTALQKIFSQ
ncbi:MAG: Uma2 family endonuclease [Verrucomicrobiales bacterium]|jgi:Uma2 family endonuclease